MTIARKSEVRRVFAALAVTVGVLGGASSFASNVTVTGEKNGLSPSFPLNLNRELGQLVHASERPSLLNFPQQRGVGEVIIPGAFDPSGFNPGMQYVRTPFFRYGYKPEIMNWDSPGDSALRIYMGDAKLSARGGVQNYLSARALKNQYLEEMSEAGSYGYDASSTDSPENARIDSLSLGRFDLESFAEPAL